MNIRRHFAISFLLTLIFVCSTCPPPAFAADDSADALYEKARKLEEGAEGEDVDVVQALRLYEEAMEKGSLEAQASLAEYYCWRTKLDKSDDWTLARRLALEPARQGVADANSLLGDFYAKGLGVEQDETRAKDYYKKAFKQYQKDAESGNSSALLALANAYLEGEGVEKDVIKGVEYLQKAADLNNSVAMAILGMVYLGTSEFELEAVEVDEKKGVAYLRKASDLGNGFAMVLLGTLYMEGVGVREDAKRGLEYLRRAAETEPEDMLWVAMAAQKLAIWYEVGEGDFDEAIKWFQKGSNLGWPFAIFGLGCCYEHGAGVDKDITKAIELFLKVVESNNYYGDTDGDVKDLAIDELGDCLSEDEIADEVRKRTMEWLEKKAESGSAAAMTSLGISYLNRGDEDKMIMWYRRAAELDYPRAMCWLGRCYKYGHGVEEDKTKAVEWYRKAAELENDEAMLALGRMYLYGDGVEEDEPKAVEWFRKAAELDNDGAMYELGICYENGYGVKKDKSQAKKWFGKAADSGNEEALEKLDDEESE